MCRLLTKVPRIQAGGNYRPSFTSRCLEDVDKAGDVAQQERLIQETAANFYAGTPAGS